MLLGIPRLSYDSIPQSHSAEETVVTIAADPRVVCRVNTGNARLVALTFDDGPDPRFTPRVLDILKHYHIKATFFIVGQNAEKYPYLVRRIAREGHSIQNHTYSHPDLPGCNRKKASEELLKNEAVIKRLSGKSPRYFRPPKGLLDDEIIEISRAKGYRIVLWTVAVENSTLISAEDVAMSTLNRAQPGAILLAHDGRLDRSLTVEALPFIIQGYHQKGYRFVLLEELLNYEAIDR